MTLTVTVEKKCGRCGSTEEVKMPIAEAQKLDEFIKAQEQADKELAGIINEQLDASHPDVVICVRAPDGNYNVKSLRDLCDYPGAKRNKGCKSRVTGLLQDVFMEKPAAPPKKPAAPKKAPPKKDEGAKKE